MQVARDAALTKINNPVYSIIRNTSCSRGWLRILVEIIFAILIVVSFILIILMSLGAPHREPNIPKSRCTINRCRVVCKEAPFFGLYEDHILNTISETSLECESIVLQLNYPYFVNGRIPKNWLSEIHHNVRELKILKGNIRYIPPYAFMNSFGNNLRILSFKDIEISLWKSYMLLGLSNLETLQIIDCSFGKIEENALIGVDRNLKYLKIKSELSWNPINVTGLADLAKLRTVDFSSNVFEHNLQNASFSRIINCQILFLNSCKIKSIGSGTFNYFRHLEELYLNDNLLVTIPLGLFDNILPQNPRIVLQDNLWFCDCSIRDIRILVQNKLLIYDPICRFPDTYNGMAFSDFEGYCKKNVTMTPKSQNTTSPLRLCQNISKVIYMNDACHESNSSNTFKIYPYDQNVCLLNRFSQDYIISVFYRAKDYTHMSSDWIKPVFAIQRNPYTIIEIAVTADHNLGLIWYHSSCIKEIYCVNSIPTTLKVYDINVDMHYVFCPFNVSFGIILTDKCVSLRFNDFQNIDTNISKKGLILNILISFGCLIFGAISVYALIHKNPSLLKGNKRVIFVKHKSIEALVLPPHRTKRNNLNIKPPYITKNIIDKKIFLLPDNLNSCSQNFIRSISMRSSESNEAGYISPLQPTEEQLSDWRSHQITQHVNGGTSIEAANLSLNSVYDSEPLPCYYLPIHTSERIYEVPK